MRIRKSRKADLPQIISLAKKYELDYTGMVSDDFWVAAEGPKILGIVGLKEHPDCVELCALGVDEARRKRGLGRELVLALLKKAKGDIYLATIIPFFFEKLGFHQASLIPASMVKKSDWCKGCRKDLCTVMIKSRP